MMEEMTKTMSYFRKRQTKENITGFLFVLPAIIAFTLFLAIPLVMIFVLMFMNYNLIQPPTFIGLDNFRRLAIDPLFRRTLGNTVRFFAVITPIHTVLALGLAYMVFQVRNTRLRSLYRGLIFFPVFVTTASVAMVWAFMFQTDLGVVNFFIRQFGGSNVPWMTDFVMVYVTIALFSAWKFIGTTFLFYFIGLQNVPTSYLEAAMIDGAGKLQTFFRVTVPLISPTMFFVFVTTMIGVFQIFEEPFFIATNNADAMSLALHIYNNAFLNMRFGYASLISTIMFLIIMTITVFQFWMQRKWVNYDYE